MFWLNFAKFILIPKLSYMKGLLILGILICSTLLLHAQKTLTGKITDKASGASLAGASVKIKGSKRGTSTNNEGLFTLQVNPGDILIISNIGYTPQDVAAPEGSSINILLEPLSAELTQVVFVGSRGAGRVKTESPVPVDVIHVSEVGQTAARPDLMSQLNIAVPSFNYNKQSGADGSDANDFASLRGLGFDQTLVLVNGKRRHLSAFVNEAGTRGRGNSGTDLNAIPESAIDRVEILRDGASAQYGSDAIAGVINIILKKDINHLNITTGGSAYDDHKYNALNFVDPSQYYTGNRLDGATYTLGADYGWAIGRNGGFINIGGNFLTQGKTYREDPDTNMSVNPQALPINGVRRAFGDGAVTTVGGMLNGEIPIAGTRTKFYFFGGYNHKLSTVYAYTRNFSANPQKFPTNPDGTLIFDANIMKVAGAGDGTINSNNVYYDPQEKVHIIDKSAAVGLEGTIGDGWDWDVSNVIGNNDFHYHGYETFNASLNNTPGDLKTNFDDGGFSFTQNTANIDVSKRFAGVAHGLTFSFGGEYRYEHYKLYAGEPDSYGYAAPAKFFPNLSGNGQGDSVKAPATGSEGYPGYQPSDEGKASRTNFGGYVDFAFDFTSLWLVDVAARFENYSDFGFVNTYKLATRYKLTDNFNLRGSVSTGFRAPSLQQINFSNTNTNVVNGQLVYVKLVPNYSPIARAAGIPKLTQETSVNGSLGFAWQILPNLTATVDGYWVQMKHRVVITGDFDGSVEAIAPYLTQYNVSSVNFFANAVNTTNTGVDIVLDYNKRWGKNRLKVTLAGNVQNINIDKINIPDALNGSYANQQAFFSTREQYFLKASAPRAKGTLAVEYSLSKFGIGAHLNYFGKVVTQGFGYASLPGAAAGGPGGAGISDQGLGWDPYVETDDGTSVVPENFVHKGKLTTDLYVSYKVSKNLVWYAGVDNIFNVHPDLSMVPNARNESAYDSESGGPFDSIQMGFNGLRLFSKLSFNF
jgi:iron complex outermembrane recepter protein